jgi:hypothetical protein
LGPKERTFIERDVAVLTSSYSNSYNNDAYSMSKAGKRDRFAIAAKSNTGLLFGYVFSNGNGTWSVERAGKKLREVYASIDEAAKALIALTSKPSARCLRRQSP